MTWKRKPVPADAKAHMAYVASLPCLACGGTANVHHIHSDGYQHISRDHFLTVPLCRNDHQDGPNAVHKIGHRAFCEMHGIDLVAEAMRLATTSKAAEKG